MISLLVLSGALIVVCDLDINLDVDESTQQQVERICEKPGSLAKDLAIQLADPSFTDWTLICEDEKILCHRVILGSRSSVFKVMFEQAGFNESKTLQTHIKVINSF